MQALAEKLGLSPQWLAIITACWHTHIADFELWAYGSRATQKAHAGSDLDLLIINPANPCTACSSFTAFRQALQESNVPILVDVQDWARLPEAFQQEIAPQKILLLRPPLP